MLRSIDYVSLGQILRAENYQLLHRIGSGRYSDVFSIRKGGEQLLIAKVYSINYIKTLVPEGLDIQDIIFRQLELFKTIGFMDRVAHHQEILRGGNYIILVMEYMHGVTLDRFAKFQVDNNIQINEDLIVAIIHQLVGSLYLLDKSGIYHNSLTPNNIYMDCNFISGTDSEKDKMVNEQVNEDKISARGQWELYKQSIRSKSNFHSQNYINQYNSNTFLNNNMDLDMHNMNNNTYGSRSSNHIGDITNNSIYNHKNGSLVSNINFLSEQNFSKNHANSLNGLCDSYNGMNNPNTDNYNTFPSTLNNNNNNPGNNDIVDPFTLNWSNLNIKVGDFSFQYNLDQNAICLSSQHNFLKYKAPEAFTGGIYDTNNNIWAIGLIALDLCLGRDKISSCRLLCSENPNYIIQILTKKGYSSVLIDFIMGCLVTSVVKRLKISQLVCNVLFQRMYVSNYNDTDDNDNKPPNYLELYQPSSLHSNLNGCDGEEDNSQLYVTDEGYNFLLNYDYISKLIEISNKSHIMRNFSTVGHLLKDLVEDQDRRFSLSSGQLLTTSVEYFTAFLEIIKIQRYLRELDIGGFNLGPARMSVFFKTLKFLSHIKILWIFQNGISDQNLTELSYNFKYNSRLEALSLHHNDITDYGLNELSKNIRYIPRLEGLSLHHNAITDYGTSNLLDNLKYFRSLTTIWLHDNPICNKEYIREKIQKNVITIKHIFIDDSH